MHLSNNTYQDNAFVNQMIDTTTQKSDARSEIDKANGLHGQEKLVHGSESSIKNKLNTCRRLRDPLTIIGIACPTNESNRKELDFSRNRCEVVDDRASSFLALTQRNRNAKSAKQRSNDIEKKGRHIFNANILSIRPHSAPVVAMSNFHIEPQSTENASNAALPRLTTMRYTNSLTSSPLLTKPRNHSRTLSQGRNVRQGINTSITNSRQHHRLASSHICRSTQASNNIAEASNIDITASVSDVSQKQVRVRKIKRWKWGQWIEESFEERLECNNLLSSNNDRVDSMQSPSRPTTSRTMSNSRNHNKTQQTIIKDTLYKFDPDLHAMSENETALTPSSGSSTFRKNTRKSVKSKPWQQQHEQTFQISSKQLIPHFPKIDSQLH